jgi:hypothetical protein
MLNASITTSKVNRMISSPVNQGDKTKLALNMSRAPLPQIGTDIRGGFHTGDWFKHINEQALAGIRISDIDTRMFIRSAGVLPGQLAPGQHVHPKPIDDALWKEIRESRLQEREERDDILRWAAENGVTLAQLGIHVGIESREILQAQLAAARAKQIHPRVLHDSGSCCCV